LMRGHILILMKFAVFLLVKYVVLLNGMPQWSFCYRREQRTCGKLGPVESYEASSRESTEKYPVRA